MYKEILNTLKTKFVGVSETILDRVAKKLAETVTKAEDVKTAVDGVTFQQVLESYGDSRATDATKTAVLNYEKKHGLKDGQKVETEKPKQVDDNTDDTTPKWAQALVSGMNTLKEEVAHMKAERVASTRKQQMSEVLAKIPESLRKGYERINVESMDEDAFNTLLTEVTNEVSEIAKEKSAEGAAFGVPTVSHGSTDPIAEISDEQAAAVAEQLIL